MWKELSYLTVNHTRHTQAELKLLAALMSKNKQLPAWEIAFFEFLNDWFNESTYITSYTSGSTGPPRPLTIAKEAMIASAQLTVQHLQLSADMHALLCLSCRHIAGKMMVIRAMVAGMNLLVTEPSSLPLKKVMHERIDFAALVPMQLSAMLYEPAYVDKISAINTILIGGSEIPPALRTKLHAFPNRIYETFGMTETISHIALKLISQHSTQNYFTTLPGITVAADENNRLIIHAPYLSVTPLITNDIVELLDNTRFRWLGRIDNVVNSAGIKLYPEQLEERLRPYLFCTFFLAGISDVKWGQKLIMLIETEKPIEKESIMTRIAPLLDTYEMPKDIFFLPRFVYTSNGKINRKATLHLLQ